LVPAVKSVICCHQTLNLLLVLDGFLVMFHLPSGKLYKKLWKITMLFMGKLTMSMVIFNR
jgi:hypothetical protein